MNVLWEFFVWLLKVGSTVLIVDPGQFGDVSTMEQPNVGYYTAAVYEHAIWGPDGGHYVETRAGDVSTMEKTGVKYYTAAVYEHAIYLPELEESPLTRHKALEEMMKNIRVFQVQATQAGKQGADIIVFPEDGVYGMMFRTRDQIFPFLEYIPEIGVQWNPCTQPGVYRDTDVQTYLSCMAKDNGLYVVANIGDVQPCNRSHDPKCPEDGRYQFNTNVVYGPDGAYITKYHKCNLYYEYQFNTPAICSMPTFDTHFGRFGLFICFDIIFEEPPITLVEKHNITDIIFPTAWMDAAPFLTSIQYHSSFAMAHRINLLSSNIHIPSWRFRGSGIFTPVGPAAYYYNTSDESPGKLIIAKIPTINKDSSALGSKTKNIIDINRAISKLATETGQDVLEIEMFKDIHHAVELKPGDETSFVCHTNLCCTATYTLSPEITCNNKTNVSFLTLAAYDGLHKNARYHMQICSIVRCQKSVSGITCGRPYLPRQSTNQTMTPEPHDKPAMSRFTLSGNFSTEYIYPQILLEGDLDVDLTPYPRQWTYNNGRLTSLQQYSKPLNVASLFGRYYQKDLSKAS